MRPLLLSFALALCSFWTGCTPAVGPRVDAGAQPPLLGCASGTRDGDETDVDCGASCVPCRAGALCAQASDCHSGRCTQGRCEDPTCLDGAQGGDETDLDCGGNCPPCADTQRCLSPHDCASGVCAATCRSRGAPCPAGFAGCVAFSDLTASDADRTLDFGRLQRFEPSCVRIRLGQSVTFVGGSFDDHPLRFACGPFPTLQPQSDGTTATFAFTQALGLYGFFCDQHGDSDGGGMAGAIEVVP